ncbi:MAG: ABC transporter substrate-binding protein [Oscillospiraceae bacterium]|nr:ABC transporter substrate-binding protein [Oscillospiraceae bacterium]
MKKSAGKRILILFLAVCLTMAAGCGKKPAYDPNEGVETKTVTDGAGRSVVMPAEVTAIAPSGSTAQMILMTIAPDLLVGLSASPTRLQRPYFPESMWYLPTFGQFYGSKSTLNMEALIAARPQLVIDLGDRKTTIRADMNSIQRQTGLPTVFFEATLETMPDAYRSLGEILDRREEAEELAAFVEETLAMAAEKRALIPEAERKTVMYGTGATGLAVNADESSQAQVIDLVGGKNAIIPDRVTNKGGGTTVSLEGVYRVQPDVILFMSGGPYDEVTENEWSELNAVRNGEFYEIPNVPYCWMSSPPSVNMVLGVWWLGQVLYPDVYDDYDMVEVAQRFYRLFWHYDLSEQEAREMLSRSLLKTEGAA